MRFAIEISNDSFEFTEMFLLKCFGGDFHGKS